MHFGEHLTIDGYGGMPEKLNDKNIVLNSIVELVSKLGMRPLSEPQIYRAFSNNLKDPGGWSGFIIIHESHISIHTFPAREFLSADIYTCKNNLDRKMIEDYFTNVFLLQDLETNFIVRGTRYPDRNETDIT